MPMPDYAKTFGEQLWVANEPTFNTLAYPVVTDAVVPLPGMVLPLPLPEFTPSQERRQTQGVGALIKRKRIVGAWSIPLYLKAAAAAGSVPSWGLLAKKAFGVETINAGVSVVYSLAADQSEQTVSIWQWVDNVMWGFRGCLVNMLRADLLGTDEVKLTFSGHLLNGVFAGTTTLNGAVDGVTNPVAAVVTDSTRFQIGPAATDRVRVQIDAEILEITAINYGTHTLTLARAQAGSSIAAHSNGAEVAPWKPGADTDPADTLMPLTLGAVDLGALTGMRVISASVLLDNGYAPRLDEYAQAVSTGFRREKRRAVTGELKAYLRQAHQTLLTDGERELERSSTFAAGDTTSARARFAVPKLRLGKPEQDGGGPEFVLTIPYQGLENAGNDELTLTLD